MAIFTPEKRKAIETVAMNFGFKEITTNPGIFMDENKIMINTLVRTGASGYTGLPMIGKYENGEPDENDNSPIIEQVREAIAAAFKAIPKSQPRVQHDSKTGHGDAPKVDIKEEEAIQEQKAPEKPVKIISCCVCGFEIPHIEALEQADNGIRPAEMKHADCKENKLEPEKEKVMNETLPAIPESKSITGIKALNIQDIKTYLCPKATDSEAYMFLQLCVNRGLNPFLREAYLIKYGEGAASMVVGKDAFTRKAEESGKLDGFRAGIILLKEGNLEEREGTLVLKGEDLVGGWAEISRNDMKGKFVNKVGMNEFNKNQGNWKTMPAVMIRKCALVGALREAFTKELGGCYDAAEVGDGGQ